MFIITRAYVIHITIYDLAISPEAFIIAVVDCFVSLQLFCLFFFSFSSVTAPFRLCYIHDVCISQAIEFLFGNKITYKHYTFNNARFMPICWRYSVSCSYHLIPLTPTTSPFPPSRSLRAGRIFSNSFDHLSTCDPSNTCLQMAIA